MGTFDKVLSDENMDKDSDTAGENKLTANSFNSSKNLLLAVTVEKLKHHCFGGFSKNLDCERYKDKGNDTGISSGNCFTLKYKSINGDMSERKEKRLICRTRNRKVNVSEKFEENEAVAGTKEKMKSSGEKFESSSLPNFRENMRNDSISVSQNSESDSQACLNSLPKSRLVDDIKNGSCVSEFIDFNFPLQMDGGKDWNNNEVHCDGTLEVSPSIGEVLSPKLKEDKSGRASSSEVEMTLDDEVGEFCNDATVVDKQCKYQLRSYSHNNITGVVEVCSDANKHTRYSMDDWSHSKTTVDVQHSAIETLCSKEKVEKRDLAGRIDLSVTDCAGDYSINKVPLSGCLTCCSSTYPHIYGDAVDKNNCINCEKCQRSLSVEKCCLPVPDLAPTMNKELFFAEKLQSSTDVEDVWAVKSLSQLEDVPLVEDMIVPPGCFGPCSCKLAMCFQGY